ncbi:ferritin-like domain-containing protein [Fimbriimonas ginsengisoli]|nr:ferritin-like domain-containing protein [Fimbriimonas ginsengisoli]
MQQLIEECVKDLYSVEKQLTKALPRLIKAAQHPRLKASLQTHLEETTAHVKRVEEAAKAMGFKPSGMLCKGMQGIIEECSEHLKEAKPGPVADAMIIGLAQKAEHYEICGYGTLLEYMKSAGMREGFDLLKENMAEEERCDQLLSQLAESEINRTASQVQPAEKPKGPRRASSSTKASSNGKPSSNGKAKSPRDKVSVR